MVKDTEKLLPSFGTQLPGVWNGRAGYPADTERATRSATAPASTGSVAAERRDMSYFTRWKPSKSSCEAQMQYCSDWARANRFRASGMQRIRSSVRGPCQAPGPSPAWQRHMEWRNVKVPVGRLQEDVTHLRGRSQHDNSTCIPSVDDRAFLLFVHLIVQLCGRELILALLAVCTCASCSQRPFTVALRRRE
jgi:hypothetical protein